MTKRDFQNNFAVRNLQANKKTTYVIILTLSLVLSLLILLFSMNHVFSSIFKAEDRQDYGTVDVVVSYDEYSLSRLVSKRQISENYTSDINYALAFFNVESMIDDNGEYYYAKLLSSTESDFEKMIGENVYLTGFSTIITKSFSESRNLSVGDDFKVNILDHVFEYQVSAILPDQGIFSGDAFYVDKSMLLKAIYDFDFLDNFGNAVYVDLKDNVDDLKFVNTLKNDDDYKGYNIYLASDPGYVQDRADEVSSMFLGLGIIMMSATALVVASLFPILIKDIKKELGVVKSLGGRKRFVWRVYLFQWGYLLLISFLAALVISLIIINIGAYIYGVRELVFYNVTALVWTFLSAAGFIYIGARYSFGKISNLSIVDQSANKQYEKLHINLYLLLAAIIILISTYIFMPFSLAVNSLIIVVTSIFVTIYLISLAIQLVSRLIKLKKKKHSVFGIVQSKYIYDNKHIHQSVKVIFISLIVIIMVFSLRSYFDNEIKNFEGYVNFDLALVNINDYQESLLDGIKQLDVTDADPSVLYPNVEVNFDDNSSELVRMFLSMDANELPKYLDFNSDDVPDIYKNATMPYIVLPRNFSYIYDLHPGQIVTLNLNYKIQDVKFVIGGFFNTNSDIFVYSNIYEKPQYQDLVKINSIFINSDNPDNAFQELMQNYSLKMYYVLEGNDYFNHYVSNLSKIRDSLLFLTGFMILSFVIVIFNNTTLMFQDLKFDLARIKVLGMSNRKFFRNLMYEVLIIFLVIFFVSIGEILVLSSKLKYIVLLVNYFKDISTTTGDVLIGMGFAFAILFVSYLYYYKYIKKISPVDEIKTF